MKEHRVGQDVVVVLPEGILIGRITSKDDATYMVNNKYAGLVEVRKENVRDLKDFSRAADFFKSRHLGL